MGITKVICRSVIFLQKKETHLKMLPLTVFFKESMQRNLFLTSFWGFSGMKTKEFYKWPLIRLIRALKEIWNMTKCHLVNNNLNSLAVAKVTLLRRWEGIPIG